MDTTMRRVVLLWAVAVWAAGCAAPDHVEREPMAVMQATAELADSGGSRLCANQVWAGLRDRGADTEVAVAFERACAEGSEESRRGLLRALELAFVHDPAASALDILGPELSHHFRTFEWHPDDFPGGPEGPNEQFADVMVDALDLVLPERRANRSREAVVLREETSDAVWRYVTDQWVPVPGQEDWLLNRHARDAFVRMREQAAAEGVDLLILSAHRDRRAAQANAARAGNPNAVASFSAHSLGLAIDFDMSHRDEIRFDGLSTRPMAELVRMRESPVHKWLVVRGAAFGWYPYQNEPWHWEYNPPGFRDVFWAGFAGGAPERDIVVEGP